MLKSIITYILIIISYPAVTQGQVLSRNAEISVLTVGPGSELYNSFGHSAFRIKDPETKLDLVFNYGGFNFDEPHFYLKFASSKLLYKLFTYDYKYLLLEYKPTNRWVKAQVLNLDSASIQKIFNFLLNNAKPENCYYKYDFFNDNCATKIPDVLRKVLDDKVVFDYDHIKQEHSHRQLLNKYLNNHKWGRFGINIVLGSGIDKKILPSTYMFLPDYVFQGFENAKIKREGHVVDIVKHVENILPEKKLKLNSPVFTPLLTFSSICILILWMTYWNYKNHYRNRWVDFFLFTITGLVGIILCLLWFVTDHTATTNNFNILWAFAPNILIPIFVIKPNLPGWLKLYVLFLIFMILILVILWSVKIQIFPLSLIPILIMLLTRYFYIIISFSNKENTVLKS